MSSSSIFFEGRPEKIMEEKYAITHLFIITSGVITTSLNSDAAYIRMCKAIMF